MCIRDRMIFKGPASEAKIIQQKTGTPTIAALDNMHVSVGEKIQVQTQRKRQPGLNEFIREAQG